MTNSISRRSFLAGAAAVTVAAATASPSEAARARRRTVVIIGAGLAGLAAAYEIQQVNPNVRLVILEARNRVGGRVWTVRADEATGEPFDDGQYVEMGAQRIPDSHDRTLGYVQELGLGGKLVPFTTDLGGGQFGRQKYVVQNQVFYSDQPWPAALNLSAFERGSSLFDSSYEYEYKYATGDAPPSGSNAVGNVQVPPYEASDWPYGDGDPETLDAWNALTLKEFHQGNGASADWERLYKASNGTEVDHIAAPAWLAQDNLDWSWFDTLYLDGGLDQIPNRLAKRVKAAGAEIRKRSQLKSLTKTSTGVEVRYRDAQGISQLLNANRVICTVPFPVLHAKVNLENSGLPTDKRDAIANFSMTPAARIAIQMKDRFWRDEGVEGLHLAGTDTGMERVWHSTNTQAGTSGIIQLYLQADNAEAAPPTDTTTWARDGLSPQIFPQVSDGSLGWNGKGMAKLWHLDPWAGGAWASPRPGEFIQGFHVWGRREGRIHFAGEHTSLYAGWMQGALESAQRAAQEVLERL